MLSDDWSGIHITVKELLPIVFGVAIWGSRWKGLTVLCRCDNAAVVSIVNSGRSRMDRVMHLMRCLSFFLVGSAFDLSTYPRGGEWCC